MLSDHMVIHMSIYQRTSKLMSPMREGAREVHEKDTCVYETDDDDKKSIIGRGHEADGGCDIFD